MLRAECKLIDKKHEKLSDGNETGNSMKQTPSEANISSASHTFRISWNHKFISILIFVTFRWTFNVYCSLQCSQVLTTCPYSKSD